eukprot:4041150-Prymnesium_polylepis.1
MAELQEYTLKHLAPGSLRCQYKSRNEFVNDGFYGREAARSRATEATCDDWPIKGGEEISLLVFNYPYTDSRSASFGGGQAAIEQHNRWFAVMELDMPTWWRPEAAGSGLPLSSTQSQKAISRPAVAKTK